MREGEVEVEACVKLSIGEYYILDLDCILEVSFDEEDPDDWEIVDISIVTHKNADFDAYWKKIRKGRESDMYKTCPVSLKEHPLYALLRDSAALHDRDTIEEAIAEASGLSHHAPSSISEAMTIGYGEWRAR